MNAPIALSGELVEPAAHRVEALRPRLGNRGALTGRYTVNDESNLLSGSFPLLPTSEQVRAQGPDQTE